MCVCVYVCIYMHTYIVSTKGGGGAWTLSMLRQCHEI